MSDKNLMIAKVLLVESEFFLAHPTRNSLIYGITFNSITIRVAKQASFLTLKRIKEKNK